MNRIYQGQVTQVEIPDPGILSAAIPFSASDGEVPLSHRMGEGLRVRVAAGRMRCSPAKSRSKQWLLFHRDTGEARRLTGRIPELRHQVEAEITARAGWSVEEQKRRPKGPERSAR